MSLAESPPFPMTNIEVNQIGSAIQLAEPIGHLWLILQTITFFSKRLRDTVKNNSGGQMVVVFTITEINYLVIGPFYN